MMEVEIQRSAPLLLGEWETPTQRFVQLNGGQFGRGERLEMQKQWHSHNYHHHSHHHHLRDQLELFIPRSVKKKVKRQRGLS